MILSSIYELQKCIQKGRIKAGKGSRDEFPTVPIDNEFSTTHWHNKGLSICRTCKAVQEQSFLCNLGFSNWVIISKRRQCAPDRHSFFPCLSHSCSCQNIMLQSHAFLLTKSTFGTILLYTGCIHVYDCQRITRFVTWILYTCSPVCKEEGARNN